MRGLAPPSVYSPVLFIHNGCTIDEFQENPTMQHDMPSDEERAMFHSTVRFAGGLRRRARDHKKAAAIEDAVQPGE